MEIHHHDHDHSCCGHEHEHSHHHHEPEEILPRCTLSVDTHDGAAVAAGECTISTNHVQTVIDKLKQEMKALAAWVDVQEGVIGHIKSGVESREMCFYSITDKTLEHTTGDHTTVVIKIAAIIYLIKPDELKNKMTALLENIITEDTK